MMTIKQRGIVIENQLPSFSRLIIFDDVLGKIDANITGKIERNRQIVHGAYIEYSYHRDRGMYFIRDIELLALPAAWVSSNIVFFHHLLEVMRFFIMYHNPNRVLVDLLKHIYVDYKPQGIITFQSQFLGKFFLLIGICPEDQHDLGISLFRLISAPIDIMLNVRDDMLVCRQLAEWLHKCLLLHPDVYRMQTKNFIEYMDMHDD